MIGCGGYYRIHNRLIQDRLVIDFCLEDDLRNNAQDSAMFHFVHRSSSKIYLVSGEKDSGLHSYDKPDKISKCYTVWYGVFKK